MDKQTRVSKCPVCGVETETKSRRRNVMCDQCRVQSQRSNRLAYEMRKIERIGIDAWRDERNLASKKYRDSHKQHMSEYDSQRHARLWQDETYRAEQKQYHKAYYMKNGDRIRERARNRWAAKKGDTGAYMALHTLQECPRLKVKAMHLPCGQRLECFGSTRCQMCPQDAKIPRLDTLPAVMCFF